jgi:hypothetical protein
MAESPVIQVNLVVTVTDAFTTPEAPVVLQSPAQGSPVEATTYARVTVHVGGVVSGVGHKDGAAW